MLPAGTEAPIRCESEKLSEHRITLPIAPSQGQPPDASKSCKPEFKDANVAVATPEQRAKKGRKSMARRSGQCGYLEKKGKSWYVRFWIDVAGQEKRAHRSVRICPVKGLGALAKPERERR